MSKYLIVFFQYPIYICYCLFKLLSSTRIGANLLFRSFNVQIGKCICPNYLLYLSKYPIVFFQCPIYQFAIACSNSFLRSELEQIIQCPIPQNRVINHEQNQTSWLILQWRYLKDSRTLTHYIDILTCNYCYLETQLLASKLIYL